MKNSKKKLLTAFLTAVVFTAGVVCGDLFNAYLPLKTLEFKKQSANVNLNSDNSGKNETEDMSDEQSARVQEILSSMTLDEKIYQMMFVTPESLTGVGTCIAAGETTKKALEDMPVGGIIYSSANVKDKEQLTEMIKNTQSYSKLPLFIGVIEEGGKTRQLASNESLSMKFISDMSDIGKTNDTSKAYSAAKTIAASLGELGFNVDFAPTADIGKNGESGASFGSDTNNVSKMSLAFTNGLQDNNISACLKHFPCGASSASVSAEGFGENTNTKEKILNDETAAFKKAIDAGCDFVMSAHIAAKSLTEESVPCSLSKAVVTDILKNDMNFKNIVITDALDSTEITKNYSASEAAVMAIAAGNDMILMPGSITEAVDAIKKSVSENKISENQINDSVKRILTVKLKRKLISAK